MYDGRIINLYYRYELDMSCRCYCSSSEAMRRYDVATSGEQRPTIYLYKIACIGNNNAPPGPQRINVSRTEPVKDHLHDPDPLVGGVVTFRNPNVPTVVFWPPFSFLPRFEVGCFGCTTRKCRPWIVSAGTQGIQSGRFLDVASRGP